jgi:hypothetical protein
MDREKPRPKNLRAELTPVTTYQDGYQDRPDTPPRTASFAQAIINEAFDLATKINQEPSPYPVGKDHRITQWQSSVADRFSHLPNQERQDTIQALQRQLHDDANRPLLSGNEEEKPIPAGMARNERTGELVTHDPVTGGTGPTRDILIGLALNKLQPQKPHVPPPGMMF